MSHLAPWDQSPDPRAALRLADPAVFDAIEGERRRQQDHIELIASENYVSQPVLAAIGSAFTNKYAEGLPGARYYGGCEFVDIVEQLAIDRAKQLFGADHANVQPHAGAPANMAAFYALLNPGDRVLGMKLDHGGHLTHGAKFNFSGRTYEFHGYGVQPDTETLDYDVIRQMALEVQPRLILCGASAYPRLIDCAPLRAIADEVGAYLMMDMAHVAGLVAADLHPDPVPYCDIVTTTTHKTLRGARGGLVLCKADHARKVDKAVFPGLQGGPLVHQIAGKAVALGEALAPAFKSYAQAVLDNMQVLASELMAEGLRLVSGGTDNHLALVDVTPFGIGGATAETALGQAGITVNKNLIPYDARKPGDPSGIRIGAPAMTTRGLGAAEFQQIARWMAAILRHPDAGDLQKRIASDVSDMLAAFPVPA
ncbi:MAG: serine hydroxymethyltransferase [Caldilineales bacterium]|nr:serine hydroxymethyltransferase [Caldilineales bacterium]MCW5859244.1 serine hydroxymethyltransferase [Caldilineales bacterium]